MFNSLNWVLMDGWRIEVIEGETMGFAVMEELVNHKLYFVWTTFMCVCLPKPKELYGYVDFILY